MRLYSQISREERRVIHNLLYRQRRESEISDLLNRDRSTINREIKRNKTYAYHYNEAHEKSQSRKHIKERKLDTNGTLRLIVCTLLIELNSPAIIAFYLKSMFPDDLSMQVSHEAIYQWIYEQKDEQGALIFTRYLFTRRKKRQNRSNTYKIREVDAKKRRIRERPEAANTKSEPGHLEGDLIESAGKDAYMLTLVDRQLKHTWGLPLQTKDSQVVSRAVVEVLSDLPDSFVKTITFDNGTEFSAYSIIEKGLECVVYFADPYCAWQRGLNEHTNGRIRQFLPKKESFAYLTDEICEDILDTINNRPRKSLYWKTPKELMQAATVALEP